jgi:hypothetical protein
MKKLIMLCLLIISLLLIGCSQKIDPEGNTEEGNSLAGQVVYTDITNAMLDEGYPLKKEVNYIKFNVDVGEVAFKELTKNIENDLRYAYKYSPKEIYVPSMESSPYDSWSWMATAKPGIEYRISMKTAGTLTYHSNSSSSGSSGGGGSVASKSYCEEVYIPANFYDAYGDTSLSVMNIDSNLTGNEFCAENEFNLCIGVNREFTREFYDSSDATCSNLDYYNSYMKLTDCGESFKWIKEGCTTSYPADTKDYQKDITVICCELS